MKLNKRAIFLKKRNHLKRAMSLIITKKDGKIKA